MCKKSGKTVNYRAMYNGRVTQYGTAEIEVCEIDSETNLSLVLVLRGDIHDVNAWIRRYNPSLVWGNSERDILLVGQWQD